MRITIKKLNAQGFHLHILLPVLAILAVAGIGVYVLTTTHAANGQDICAQAGTGYCLNDWNGAATGGAIKMYNANVLNDAFDYVPLPTSYCAKGYVSTSPACPFPSGSGLNSENKGYRLFEIQSPIYNQLCVGTDSSARANLGPCPPSNGTGRGSNVWIDSHNLCKVGNNFGDYYENVYWSSHYDNDSSLSSGGAIGAQAYVVASNGFSSCWALH